MLGPVLTGFKKETGEKADGRFYKMSSKEQIALKEARKIVHVYSSKVEHPFKSGQGSLDKKDVSN